MKKTKIMSGVLIFLVLIFTVLPVGTAQFKVDASQTYQRVDSNSGTVNADGVNLRTGPATTFTSLVKLKKGQKVTVMGKIGDWYTVYVSSNGNVGAIYSKYLKLDAVKTTAVKATSTKPTTETKQEEQPVAVKVDVSKDEQAMLDMINSARKEKGLKALEFDAGLVKIARLKVADMKENNYFSHTSSYYGTPFDMMKKYGVKFSLAGENIAGNQSIEKAVKAWLEESGNNVFNSKFTHTGIGISDSTTYGKLFVEMFIKK